VLNDINKLGDSLLSYKVFANPNNRIFILPLLSASAFLLPYREINNGLYNITLFRGMGYPFSKGNTQSLSKKTGGVMNRGS